MVKFEVHPLINDAHCLTLGKQDFRDPKVIWYNDESWILVLAAGVRIKPSFMILNFIIQKLTSYESKFLEKSNFLITKLIQCRNLNCK